MTLLATGDGIAIPHTQEGNMITLIQNAFKDWTVNDYVAWIALTLLGFVVICHAIAAWYESTGGEM